MFIYLIYVGRVLPSAGSIPDSYDIYRYLNLVRYSIFDTRYFHRKCNFVDIFRGYLKRLRHVHLLFFKKKKIIKHSGKNEIPIFFRKSDFFFSKNRFFFLENPIFFSKTYEIRRVVLVYILLFENIRNRCLVTFRVSLLHRLCRA